MQSVSTLVNGVQVGEIYKEQNIFGVIVRGETRLHTDLRTLNELMIDTPSGAQVPLGSIAELAIVPAPNEIKREAASRRIDITCNVGDRDLAAVAKDIEQAVKKNVSFKTGYHPELLGEYAEAKASRNRLLLLSLASIMLVSHYRHLATEEGVTDPGELIVRGAEERLAPIMMTALTTGLALVPLIVSGEIPGQEIEYPMGLVILCGLTTATLVHLVILPVVCSFPLAGEALYQRKVFDH